MSFDISCPVMWFLNKAKLALESECYCLWDNSRIPSCDSLDTGQNLSTSTTEGLMGAIAHTEKCVLNMKCLLYPICIHSRYCILSMLACGVIFIDHMFDIAVINRIINMNLSVTISERPVEEALSLIHI